MQVWRVISEGGMEKGKGLSEFVYAPPQTSIHKKAWAMTEEILGLLHQEVVGHNTPLLLVTVTNPNQIDPVQREILQKKLKVKTLDYPEKRIAKLGEKLAFPVLNLLYPFQAYADENQIYLHGFPNFRMGAGHWNEKGHDLAAKLIAKKICHEFLTQ
jgi:hypothetical protein